MIAVAKGKPDLVLTVHTVMIEDIKDTIGIAVNRNNYLLLHFVNRFLEQKNVKDVRGGQIGPARDAMRVLLQMLAGCGFKIAIDTSLALATVSLRRLGYL